MFRSIRFPLIVTLAALALVAFGAAAADGSVGMQVTPAHLNAAISAGDHDAETITVTNTSDGDLTVRAVIVDRQEGGGATIKVTPDTLRLAAGASSAVRVDITVPDGAAEGRFAAEVDFTVQPGASGNLAVAGQVATVLDVEVFHPVTDVSWSWPTFIESGSSAVFDARARNGGKVPASLTGSVKMSGFPFGGEDIEAATGELPAGREGELRAVWEKAPIFGMEWVTLSVSSGAGAPVVKRTLVLVFPWKVLPFAAIICLAAAAVVLPRRIR